MASLRSTATGSFTICFRFQGQQYQRGLKTKDPEAARATQGLIEHTIYRLSRGDLVAPPHTDLGDFIVRGGMVVDDTPESTTAPPAPTIEDLVQQYLDAQRGLKAESSLLTEHAT